MSKKTHLKIATLAWLLFVEKSFAFVPLVCDLCTVGVVAGLAISRYLGIDDSVTGVWIGAFVVALINATILLAEKRKWNFPLRDQIITLTFVVFTTISFYSFGVIGVYRNTLFGIKSILLDKVLVSSIIGGIVLFVASRTYQWMKTRNGGRAHFPFEKVVLPLMALALTSLAFYFMTAR